MQCCAQKKHEFRKCTISELNAYIHTYKDILYYQRSLLVFSLLNNIA